MEAARDTLRLAMRVEDMIEARGGGIRAGRMRYRFAKYLKMVFVPDVVGIEKGDPVAARRPDAKIARGISPRTGHVAVKQMQTRIIDRGGNRPACVSGAIIDDDELMRRQALGEDALDGSGDVRRLVVKRHDDGKARCGHAGQSLAAP